MHDVISQLFNVVLSAFLLAPAWTEKNINNEGWFFPVLAGNCLETTGSLGRVVMLQPETPQNPVPGTNCKYCWESSE